MTTPNPVNRAYPLGICYCGCGAKLENPSKFFVASHDRKLEARIIKEVYGDVASFALSHGYGPRGASSPA
jgi:hypothetical protein